MSKTTLKFKEIPLLFTSLTAITLAMDEPEHSCPITDENKLIEVLCKNSDNGYFRGPITFTVPETKRKWLLEEGGETNERFIDQLNHFYNNPIIHAQAHFKELKFSEYLFLSSALHNYVLSIRNCGFSKKEPIKLATHWSENKFHLVYPFPGINEQAYKSKIEEAIVSSSPETANGRAEKARLVSKALEAGFPALAVRFTLTPLIQENNQAESKDAKHGPGEKEKNKKDSKGKYIDLPPLPSLDELDTVLSQNTDLENNEEELQIMNIFPKTDSEKAGFIGLSDLPPQEEQQWQEAERQYKAEENQRAAEEEEHLRQEDLACAAQEEAQGQQPFQALQQPTERLEESLARLRKQRGGLFRLRRR